MQRPFQTSIALLLCSILFAASISGCGGGNNPAKPALPISLGGNVNKAPIAGATVNINKINTNGSIGALVAGPFTTDASGNWSGTISAGSSGPYVMVATGGSYTDEATDNSVALVSGQELYGIYLSGSCSVTPLSHATFLAMQALVTGGTPLSTAISLATSSSVTAFGFSFTTTTPSDAAAATVEQKKYAALLGGISTLLDANPALSAFASTLPVDLVIALAKDMADGKLDGLDALGAAIQVPTEATAATTATFSPLSATGTTTAPLPALSAGNLSACLTAANTFAASRPNLSTISFDVGTAWNPSNPPAPNNGTVTFSGTGLGLLNGITTCTPNISSVPAGNQLLWKDETRKIEITIIMADQGAYPGKVQTVYVIYSGTDPSVVWYKYGSPVVPGISISGGTTTFAGAVLDDYPSGTSPLTANGSLTNPVP